MWLPSELHQTNQNMLILFIVSSVIVTIEASVSKTQSDSSNSIGGHFKIDNQPATKNGQFTSNSTAVIGQRMLNNDVALELDNKTHVNDSTIESELSNPVDWSVVWPYFNTGCLQWSPINHIYFQLANSFLFLSYLAPAGLYGLIYLRTTLAIGSAFLSLWAWVIICAFDTFLWNAFFTLINSIHAVILLFSLRPMALDDHLKQVYTTMFQPLNMSKQQFKQVAKSITSTQTLKRGEYFALGRDTSTETLSLLLSGTMVVIDKGRTLYAVSAMQFLDSPQWFDSSSSHFYQVNIQACEESIILVWHRDKLQSIIKKDAFLQSVFHHILGHDVTAKLSQISRNTKIVKSKCYQVNCDVNAMDNKIGQSNNRKLSEKENMRNSSDAASSEQLSLLNETAVKTSPYRLNSERL